MRQGSDERELLAADRSRDTELTLSSTTLLAIFFGLVLVCGLCFGLGFAVGRRGQAEPAAAGAQPAAGGEGNSTASGTRAKPPATAQPSAAPPPRAVVPLPAFTAPDANAAANPAAGPQDSGAAAAAQWTVKPALPPQANAPQPATGPGAGFTVQPALAPAQALMVQIAAVSHAEDADVLVAALRKRGYAVTVRRDISDSLLHVQIGPFSTRGDAEAMRQKLLNDGYNAIVQP